MGIFLFFESLKPYLSTVSSSVAPVLDAARLFITTRQCGLYCMFRSPTSQADWFASSNSHLHIWAFCSVALYFSLSSSLHLSAAAQCVVPVQVAWGASLWNLQRDTGPSLLRLAHPLKRCSEGTAGRRVRASPVKENRSGDTWAPSSKTSRIWQASFGCARRRIFRQIGDTKMIIIIRRLL